LNKFLFLLLLNFSFAAALQGQQPDSTALPPADTILTTDTILQNDSLPAVSWEDSVSRRPVIIDTGWVIKADLATAPELITKEVLSRHPYYGFSANPVQVKQDIQKKRFAGKEWLFYLLVLLLIAYGFLKRLFPKYFSDLFRLFFRTTIKQRQVKEQLMQTPLPSLLLNGFFVVSAGLYLAFLLEHFQLNTVGNFWLLLLYCCGGLSAVYFIKFAGLKIAGWLFNLEEAADSYIFIVFVVNKMLGILLLPFLVLLAFTSGDIYYTALTLSWCLAGALIIYRFVLTYSAVRNQVKVNPFHFLLYICGFEIAPLLLIYKGLLLFFRITA